MSLLLTPEMDRGLESGPEVREGQGWGEVGCWLKGLLVRAVHPLSCSGLWGTPELGPNPSSAAQPVTLASNFLTMLSVSSYVRWV